MFVIRETFTAKPGMASKLAMMFKDLFTKEPRMNSKTRVLTDQVGAFNTVVLETETASLDAFEKEMQEYMSKPDMRDRMKGYTDLWTTGRREIYRVM